MQEGRTPMRRRVSAADFDEHFGQIETCGFDLAKIMGEECEVAVPLRTRGALFTPDYWTHEPNDRRSGSYDSVCACLNVDLRGLSCEVSSRAGRSNKNI